LRTTTVTFDWCGGGSYRWKQQHMAFSCRRPLALVTGAAGEVGSELARQLATRGYDLILVAADAERLATLAATLRAIDPKLTAICICAEISTYEGVEAMYRAVVCLGRPLSVLVANADMDRCGRGDPNARLDAELAVINRNITALVHVIERLVGGVVVDGTGKVLIVSSMTSAALEACQSVWAASRAFLRSFGTSLRAELHASGIEVVVMLPGRTEAAEFAQSVCRALHEDERMIPALLSRFAAGVGSLAD
jgi:short-subunit dehydrogenase